VTHEASGRFVIPISWAPAGRQSGPECTNFPLNCTNIGVYENGVALNQVAPPQWGPHDFFFDEASHSIWLASDPGNADIEVTRAPTVISSAAPGVKLSNLIVEHASTRGIVAAGPGWRLTDVESRWNHTYGIRTDGNDYSIQGGRFDYNGQYGLTGTGDRGLIDGVESDHNDQLHFGTSLKPGACWDSGESKWVKTTGLVVRNANVHDGFCNGFWFDLGNRNITVTDSNFTGNFGFGLIQETSHGAHLSGNTFSGNRYFGLGIVSSSGVEARFNTFSGSGLLIQQQGRGGVVRSIRCPPPSQTTQCPQVTQDNTVTGNQFSCPHSLCVRVLAQANADALRATNHLAGNRFEVGDPNLSHFQIDGQTVDAAALVGWFTAAPT
jgi:parallel beta-helix repeat protein